MPAIYHFSSASLRLPPGCSSIPPTPVHPCNPRVLFRISPFAVDIHSTPVVAVFGRRSFGLCLRVCFRAQDTTNKSRNHLTFRMSVAMLMPYLSNFCRIPCYNSRNRLLFATTLAIFARSRAFRSQSRELRLLRAHFSAPSPVFPLFFRAAFRRLFSALFFPSKCLWSARQHAHTATNATAQLKGAAEVVGVYRCQQADGEEKRRNVTDNWSTFYISRWHRFPDERTPFATGSALCPTSELCQRKPNQAQARFTSILTLSSVLIVTLFDARASAQDVAACDNL